MSSLDVADLGSELEWRRKTTTRRVNTDCMI